MENNNALQVFNYEGQQVRTVEKDGEIWFVAKDVCDILELTNPSEALRSLDNDERSTLRITEGTSISGGNPNMNVITESGVYALVFKSRKPEAKQFSRWVRSEVLPSIRKTGTYMTPNAVEKILNDPESFIEMIRAYQSEKERADLLAHQKADLEAQQERDRPKVLFADSVSVSKTSILVRDLAKILRQNGYPTGEKRLYTELRRLGFIMQYSTMPTQKAMEMGLMEVMERTINRGEGDTISRFTTKITPKGQIYFINLFLGKKAA